MRFPMVIVYAVIAFNLTVFSLMLQMDMLVFHSVIAKVIFWALTVGAWVLTYVKRNKFVKFF